MFIARGMPSIAPTMDAAPPIVLYLAPEGRHVYSTRHTTNIQSPRGATGALCLNHRLDRFNGLHGGGCVCI